MDEQITFTEEEVLRIFRLLEASNEFFHQPMNFEDPKQVERFAVKNYPEIRALYYDLLWDKLPSRIKNEIIDG